MDFSSSLSTSPDLVLGGAGTALFDDIDIYSDDSITSYYMSSADKYRWFLEQQKLRLDGGVYTIERRISVPVWLENPHTRLIEQSAASTNVSISVFTTPEFPGANIRDAISGRIEPSVFTGQYEEKLYFKVKLSTGELPLSAKSKTLFFGSTKEYEDHMHTKLGDDYRNRYGLTASEIDAEIMACRIEVCKNRNKVSSDAPICANPVSGITMLWNGKSYRDVLKKI
jgi:hypothetical protein